MAEPLGPSPLDADHSPRPCVYLVSPDETARQEVEALSRSAGLTCRVFAQVDECIGVLQGGATGCVVADAQLSRTSPAELLRSLAPRCASVPLIVLTDENRLSTAVAAMRAGAFDVVAKPEVGQQLLQAILGAIAEQRFRRDRCRSREEVRRRYEQLTPREREVFHLVAAGCRSRLIADRLGINEKTVEVYRSRVNHKMNTHNAAELAHLSRCIDL